MACFRCSVSLANGGKQQLGVKIARKCEVVVKVQAQGGRQQTGCIRGLSPLSALQLLELHAKLLSQVYLAHVNVTQYFLGCPRGNDAPLAYYVSLFTDVQSVAHIVIGDQNANTPVA